MPVALATFGSPGRETGLGFRVYGFSVQGLKVRIEGFDGLRFAREPSVHQSVTLGY